MADVDAQLEANGLPTQFQSSANQPEVSHAVTNAAATVSNAEASALKQTAPDLDLATISQPVQPPQVADAQPDASAPPANDVLLENGSLENQAAEKDPPPTQVNGHGHSAAAAEEANSPQPTASVANTVQDLSSQSQPASSNTTLDSTIPISTLTEPLPTPDQAPVSNLRTAPHSDQLAPDAVAKIEAEKHEMDNNADIAPEIATAPVPSAESVTARVPSQELPIATPPPAASPPPPPPPEPAHATLPVEPQSDAIVSTIETVNTNTTGEQPVDPAPTPAIEQDEEMTDAPAPPTKAVHEREEDQESDEPAPKRLKTEDDYPMTSQAGFKVPESPAPATQVPEEPGDVDPDDAVTTPRLQHMKKVISNLKKSNASSAFRLPVDPVALKIPTYFDFVKKPMDLGTIDNRLKRNEYTSVQAFRNDFGQIIQNCMLFNGPDHAITQAGRKMESSFNNQMAQLPPTNTTEPSKVDIKKAVKPKVEPIRAPASRRQSVNAKAASPTAASPATFAPDPNGMPLIRRDSAIDGRPKRAIVPPKRNSDFGGARPKKKKYELELKFCDEALKNIMSNKHWATNQYFMHPVDPVALNIPQYFQVIKKPMDLSTVRQKLDGGHYEKAKDFEEDVRLIFKNCFKFNPEGDYVHGRGQELEKLFTQEWSKKREWIQAREPESEPASIGDDEGDDDASEEEAEVESEDDDRKTQLQQLEAELEAIKNRMGELSKQSSATKPQGASSKTKTKKPKNPTPKTQFPGLSKPAKIKKPIAKKTEKDRYVTFAEKQYISNGIAMLPERPMSEALKIIQNSVPALANSDQGEIELDIEEVPNHALLKLLSFVKKYAGPPPEESKEQEYVVPTVNKTKKSKTMSRQDQDAQIAELRGTLHHYQEGISPDAVQSIETGAEDSDDDDESNEESEEE